MNSQLKEFMIPVCDELTESFSFDKTDKPSLLCASFTVDDYSYELCTGSDHRDVKIKSVSPVKVSELYKKMLCLNDLIMLFEGRFFYPIMISTAHCTNHDDKYAQDYVRCQFRDRLPPYYYTRDLFINMDFKLLLSNNLLNSDLFKRWCNLAESLKNAFTIFKAATSTAFDHIDVGCAFMIELAEAFVDILKENTGEFSSLNPGDRGTSLKLCLDVLISTYGKKVFQKEWVSMPKLLEAMTKSRISIMHVKRNENDKAFDGEESAVYLAKLSLLYRIILFHILGIEDTNYSAGLDIITNDLDAWNSTVDGLMKRL